jgi:hypothetical protein
MLLLTFVENTSKYATMNSKGELFIDISSILTNGNQLSLQVKKVMPLNLKYKQT